MKNHLVYLIEEMTSETQPDIEVLNGFGVLGRFISLDSDFQSVENVSPSAIKIGRLNASVAPELLVHSGPVVYCPEGRLTQQSLPKMVQWLPFVDVFCLNQADAELILKRAVGSYQEIKESAHALLALGAKSVLLTGGHVKDAFFSQDYWTNGSASFWIANQRSLETPPIRKGATLALAITAALALGYSMKDAIVLAKMAVSSRLTLTDALKKQAQVGFPEDQAFLPYLSPKPITDIPVPFKQCRLGLYPVVDSSDWVETLLRQGVSCIQLRIKNASQTVLEEEIKRSILLAKQHHAILFVNDYWELALRLNAPGIHLGQEDLPEADIEAIRRRGMYLGISTYCHYEVARAHALNPSYIACGPIYSTTSKIIDSQPQGINTLRYWRKILQYPLVAIGGITLSRLPDVLRAGVEGVSVISAITNARDPMAATAQFLKGIHEYQGD